MAVAGCINAYDCAGCYLTTLQQLQSDNIGVAINYTAPSEYGRRQLDYIKYTDKCGCTCCLTGENELRIVATQGVIKNFTLTNDDTNEVVKVKWNDLFGSNRAYTMVRYKTGSYPTSITDGTLAVKETTQNQYSTSGYNVSGLTDGTTYYFTAFAVSQDGTIIVVQNKNITTNFARKPGTNTVAYYPFKNDIIDKTGKTSLSGGVYEKIAVGYQFRTNSNVVVNSLSNARFISYRFRQTQYISGSNYSQIGNTQYAAGYNTLDRNDSTYGNAIQFKYSSNGYHTYKPGTTANQRIHLAYGWTGSVFKIYVNGVLKSTYNSSNYVNEVPQNGNYLIYCSNSLGNNSYINFSDLIYESVVWSDSEVSEYFNKTKSTYGL